MEYWREDGSSFLQIISGPLIVRLPPIVTLLELEHPVVELVKVKVTVPVPTPVRTPAFVTVAMAVLLLLQVPPVFGVK
jgi:hypothetical protein